MLFHSILDCRAESRIRYGLFCARTACPPDPQRLVADGIGLGHDRLATRRQDGSYCCDLILNSSFGYSLSQPLVFVHHHMFRFDIPGLSDLDIHRQQLRGDAISHFHSVSNCLEAPSRLTGQRNHIF